LADVHALLTNAWRLDLAGNCLSVMPRRPRPGFVGSVGYIHPVDWPGLFEVEVTCAGAPVQWEPASHTWGPAGMRAEYAGGGLALREAKTITRHDVAACQLIVTRTAAESAGIEVWIRPLLPGAEDLRAEGDTLFGTVAVHLRPSGLSPMDFVKHWALRCPGAEALAEPAGVRRSATLGPGESLTLTVALALRDEPGACLIPIGSMVGLSDPVAANAERENAWYADRVPPFACSDPLITRLYYYRWYLARRNTVDARAGFAGHPYDRPCVFESRSGRASARLSPHALAQQLVDLSWMRVPDVAQDLAWVVLRQGQVLAEASGGRTPDPPDWTPMALWRLMLVHPDPALLAAAYPEACRLVRGWASESHDVDRDGRPEVRESFAMGLEYLPSFFYFTQPRWDHTQGEEFGRAAGLERPDTQGDFYLSAMACAAMAVALGREAEAREWQSLADRAKSAALEVMWDAGIGFFCPVEPRTHERAPVKEATGFVPFIAGLAGPEHVVATAALSDPNQFGTPFPVPSVSMDCEAFSPSDTWIAGPNASPQRPHMYRRAHNGPSWPQLTSLVADAAACACRLAPGDDTPRMAFAELFRKYTRMHFRGDDPPTPCVVDEYHPLTGEWLGDSMDCFASHYIDLVVRHVAGLQPRADGVLEIWPIDIGLQAFSLQDVPYQGHVISIMWERGGPGLIVTMDGKAVARQPGLSPPITVQMR